MIGLIYCYIMIVKSHGKLPKNILSCLLINSLTLNALLLVLRPLKTSFYHDARHQLMSLVSLNNHEAVDAKDRY